MEIGSFLELQLPKGRELYKGDINIARLNTGRMGLWHAFRVTRCKRIWLPVYQCDSIRKTFEHKGVEMCFYHQDEHFNPIDIDAVEGDAVLLVNYFGVMSKQRMTELAKSFKHPIIDCAQAFFCKPIEDALMVYSCRKFIGVPDGAYVIGKEAHRFIGEYQQSYSSDTSAFLLLRIEYGCEGKGYESRSMNEHRIDNEDCMLMSKLTRTILDAEDYDFNKKKRVENFMYAQKLFGGINKIDPTEYFDEGTIPMVYPLVVEDDHLLHVLQTHKHFQGHWWSYICQEQIPDSFEYWMSRYIIPITIDQRYGKEELDYLSSIIYNYLNNER